MNRRAAALALLLLALGGCHSQPTAGGLTADDERALDNAAAMLDDPVFNAAAANLAAPEADNRDASNTQ